MHCDPKRLIDNLGRINETVYDNAGRVIETIQNYQDGNPATESGSTYGADQDVTVNYQYDSAGRLVTMIAYDATAEFRGHNTSIDKMGNVYNLRAWQDWHGWLFLVCRIT